VANELKHHPRITEYSILKNNVGVSRAWNIGLNISRTPYTFILNSDLKISLVAITQLLGQIKTLDRAAIVGPQGAFFDFESMKDYYFFDKGSFNKTIQVDAVSGFFFVVNNKLFNENGLAFDNRFTPCYREEWDIGLQIKSANLCCYIAPVTDYDHQWSGSIRAYKKIRYYDQEQTPKEILERTGRDFQQKWREIAKTKNTEFLHSGWKLFALNMTEIFLKNNQPEQAVKIINLLSTQFLNDYEILAEQGLVAYHQGQIEAALDFYKKSISIKPDYQVALKNIQLINSIHSSEFIDKLTNTKNKLLTKEIRNPYFEKDHQIICRSFNEIKKTINPDILVKWLSDNLENIANGVNSINAYQMLRAISIESRFGFNRAAKKFYRNMFPSTLPISENSQRIASSLEHNGYYVFRPTKSSIKFAKDMKECLSYLRVTREKDGAVGELSNFLNNPIPGSFRYIFFEEDLPVSPVLNLLYESGVLRGVSDYIGHPILRNINAWVSTCPNNYDNHDVSRSAQAYHFDNDNPTGWTKVFIYLTDVDEDTGPHVYVPNSHLLLPEKLKRDGRFTDDEIHNGIAFGEKLIGDAGTIIIADTLGMHKGMQVKKGIRIIFQLEFVTSLIGEETSLNINSEKIIHELPSFMDERLSYRYIRDSKILSSRKC
jgi:tetratricopeptide (TPR) repeat protein